MAKLTLKQKKLLDKLEMSLVELVHENESKLATVLGPIVEMLQKGHSVLAVLQAEASKMDERVITEIRKTFDVRI